MNSNSHGRLSGKCALVTGASSGIGRGIALRFGNEGAKVAVNYGKSQENAEAVARTINTNGSEAFVVKADVSERRQVDAMVSDVASRFGKLDILVNNAGIFIEKTLLDTTDEVWNRIIDVNLRGAFLCTQRCVPEMLKIGGGKVINIASIDSIIAEPNTSAYCASKAGVVGLTTALALELAPKRINVNAIAPGQINTPMISEWVKNPEVVHALESKTPYGRLGRPEDIAAAATFLASDESEFVNGVVLPVDGGWLVQ
jgi:NAD(P)-dependent dehydrogenase (short-subunit alcohol dehydrogenase family)